MVSNNEVIPESKQGRYQRSGVLWNNEELNKLAADYVQNNSFVKGKPKMTAFNFCKWVNKTASKFYSGTRVSKKLFHFHLSAKVKSLGI